MAWEEERFAKPREGNLNLHLARAMLASPSLPLVVESKENLEFF
jgi:hypothetical protein